MQGWSDRNSPALVIALIALVIALTGTAWAALEKNSVGPRQLKSKSVTTAKFADESVTGGKVASKTLGGQDINLARLGTVGSATFAAHANNAERLGDLPAGCAALSIEARGLCFDSSVSGPVVGVKTAVDLCAARGGFLPTPGTLISIRNLVSLGSDAPSVLTADPDHSDAVFADEIYANTDGINWRATVVDATSVGRRLLRKEVVDESDSNEIEKTKELSGKVASAKFLCAYRLLR
jgi:hypothetical protein